MKTTNRPKPPKAVEGRLSRCRAAMKRLGVSAYLITNRPDQVYLTGFDGEDGAVIITSGSVHIITDGRFEETIRQQAPWANKHMRTHALADVVGTVCRKLRLKQLWFQADQVSVQQLADLRKPCRPTKLSPAPPIANDLRKLKDRAEIIRLREAIDVAEAAFKALRKQIRTGMTETDIAALLEYEMKRRGATEPSFPTIVAEGANAALPHAHPGKRRIKKGSLILIDWGARWQHYCSDLTRVLFMGTIPPRFERLYKIVLEAQIKAIDMIAAGQRCCDIDKAARDHIVAAGYGKEFGHGLGHGVGLDIHEEPRLKFGYTDKLEAGMVVTVEPGIYLPGIGGIRIEDDILVTTKGRQVLTTLPKSVASAVIKKR